MHLDQMPVRGKKVLLRVDFSVPLDEQGRISDDTRIRSALPSIRYILDQGGAVILLSHLGRPKGRDLTLTLKPCAERLSELLGVGVTLAPDCVGSEVKQLAKELNPGGVLLLENLRYHEAEEKPELDPHFAGQLAELGDMYVNDAFGSSHRAHSSIVSLPAYFPGLAGMGFLMQKEVEFLSRVIKNPQRPFLALIGGSKVSSKIETLLALTDRVDVLLIGGGMAFTFLKAEGKKIGKSLFEADFVKTAQEVIQKCKEKGVVLKLPVDCLVAPSIEAKEAQMSLLKTGIPDELMGLDIGTETVRAFSKEIRLAKTIFWNGPVGVFERELFAEGTREMAEAIAGSSAITIVGGGDSIAAIHALGMEDKFSHVSTGGGASMELIEKGSLPGLDVLKTL